VIKESDDDIVVILLRLMMTKIKLNYTEVNYTEGVFN